MVTILLAAAAPPLTYVATKLKVDNDPTILIFATMVAALGGMLATLQIFFALYAFRTVKDLRAGRHPFR